MRPTVGYVWCKFNPPGNHTHAITSGRDVGIMRRALDGEWKEKDLAKYYYYLDFIDFLMLGKWGIDEES